MNKRTFRSKPGGEVKWFEVGRVVMKSTSLRAINGRARECNESLALRRRVQGIEFWDYCPNKTADGEIHEM
ncbi:hypothetical protein BDN67DRAFT_976358 [Paxillus ammoniavirescens]|nr:hypothetical protein BDN67DRAFT_976358 [Paxillus ammoniavirescens]